MASTDIYAKGIEGDPIYIFRIHSIIYYHHFFNFYLNTQSINTMSCRSSHVEQPYGLDATRLGAASGVSSSVARSFMLPTVL